MHSVDVLSSLTVANSLSEHCTGENGKWKGSVVRKEKVHIYLFYTLNNFFKYFSLVESGLKIIFLIVLTVGISFHSHTKCISFPLFCIFKTAH